MHGRPIRPLPKRRLRSRLSEDVSAALFGPPQQPTTPLFYFPYNNYAGDAALGRASTPVGFGAGNHHIGENLQDSSDEEDNSNASVSRGVGNAISGIAEGAAGQADSYEWSENTNNKKKRKIPTPANPGGSTGSNGASGGGGSQSSPGFSPTSASTPRNRWKSSSSTQRSPLSAILSTNHASLRRNCRRYPSSPSTDSFSKRLTNGNSTTDEPATPPKTRRRDDSDLLGLPPPKQTQFTFVCESPVSANLAFSTPPHNTASAARDPSGDGAGYQKAMHTVGTQTSPSMSNNPAYPPTPQQPKKKPSNSRTTNSRRDYALQQQRRRRQEAIGGGGNNGEIWICEFCEYESIFGEAPEALMRQYEIKDRKERRRLAEKRRLLEKAKQKGKKNSGKNSGKKGGGNAHQGNSNSVAPPPPPPSTTDSQGTQSDNTPLASAAQIPALKPQRHSQQVQTEAYLEESNNHISTGRGAGGGGGGGGMKNGVGAGGAGGSGGPSVS